MMKIKSLPKDERPRERLISCGVDTLSNSELLSIIISLGNKKENAISIGNKLFSKYGLDSLSRLEVSSLKKISGIGDAKACKIVACFELGRRLASFNFKEKPMIENSIDVVKIFSPKLSTLSKEHFVGVYLDSKKRLIKSETIFVGSLNESVVHPREIFKRAIEESAAAVILIHNHPSGDCSPSSFDIDVTKDLIKSGELLGIPVIDHIIIGKQCYFSMFEKNVFDNQKLYK